METYLSILLNILYVVAFVSWLNTILINYIYLKHNQLVEFTKDTVITQYCYSLFMTIGVIVVLKLDMLH
jgi:hypothetical protein